MISNDTLIAKPTTMTPIVSTTSETTTTGTTTSTTTTRSITLLCNPLMVGDDICDDECNTIHFGFDGGDCCLPIINKILCFECQCHDGSKNTSDPEDTTTTTNGTAKPTATTTGTPTPSPTEPPTTTFTETPTVTPTATTLTTPTATPSTSSTTTKADTETFTMRVCSPHWLGDDICDDGCNNVNNGFDGGDCCPPPSVDTSYCSECQCLDPEHSTTTTATTITPRNCVAGWVGDNFCDDECNNIDNSFDGGDCCGPNAVFNYCSECQCHEG